MMKVIFYNSTEEEEQEFEDTTTNEEIEESFNEWIAGRSGWYIESNK